MTTSFMRNKSSKGYPFQNALEDKFKRWVGYIDEDIEEALQEVTGDTYLEMRKLTSMLLSLVEEYMVADKYVGHKDGIAFTEQETALFKNGTTQKRGTTKEDLKAEIRSRIDSVWLSMLNKQKVGMDKLFLSLSKREQEKSEDK